MSFKSQTFPADLTLKLLCENESIMTWCTYYCIYGNPELLNNFTKKVKTQINLQYQQLSGKLSLLRYHNSYKNPRKNNKIIKASMHVSKYSFQTEQ